MFCECIALILLLTIVVIVAGFFKIKKSLKIPPRPQLEHEWWGSVPKNGIDETIRPFKVEISHKVIDDLNHRLNNARPFVPPLESIQQQYGMNTKLLSEIVDYWRTKYNWRERETFLNQFPQFKTNIQGLMIHFLHVKPTSTEGLKVVPLLLVHGWPGSVREFYELIPLLIEPRPGNDFVFEVIAPSLPGFGFSDPATIPGLNPTKIGLVFKNLMHRLGFDKFYVQGGDWGGVICSDMATLFPEAVQGAHLNLSAAGHINPITKLKMLIRNFVPSIFSGRSEEMKAILKEAMHFRQYETGYFQLQSTKPDTVGVGLNDSPVGLAAYILEKFTTWTNLNWINRMDGGLLEKYTYTKLLDNVMIYWVTNSITSSMRIYYEYSKDVGSVVPRIPVTVPVAYTKFKHEIIKTPDDMVNAKYWNLLHCVDIPDGGHFAALEVPDLLAKDMWEAFSKFLDFYKK